MDITVNKSSKGLYTLKIGDEEIMKDVKQLSSVVAKIEQYLKMRFLEETPEHPVKKALKGLFE